MTTNATLLLGLLLGILIIYDSYLIFKNPLKVKTSRVLLVIGMAIVAVSVQLVFFFIGDESYSLAGAITTSLVACGVLGSAILISCKMHNQQAYYMRHQLNNIILKQVLRLQKSFIYIFGVYACWSFAYYALLGNEICVLINFAISSTHTCAVLCPFLFNIYKVVMVYPPEYLNCSLTNLSLYQIRQELLLFVIKGPHYSINFIGLHESQNQRPSVKGRTTKSDFIKFEELEDRLPSESERRVDTEELSRRESLLMFDEKGMWDDSTTFSERIVTEEGMPINLKYENGKRDVSDDYQQLVQDKQGKSPICLNINFIQLAPHVF